MNHIEPYTWMKNRNYTLKTERKRRGWTQARLAKVLGVTTRTVIRWEQGLALPHPTHRVQLETLFGRTAEDLGLWWDTDEKEAVDLILTTSSLLVSQAMSEVQVSESSLVAPSIPRTLGK